LTAGNYILSAVASDTGGAKSTNSINIIVNATPTVTIISPTNNSVFTAPANIVIEANPSDSDGTIAKVEFFNGATKLGEDINNPYSFAWNGVSAGSYSLTAKATDNHGATATSSPVGVTVRDALSSVTIGDLTITGSSVSFSFTTEAFWTYTVEFNEALGAGNWQTLHTVIGDGSTVHVVDPIGAGKRFYRVKAE